MLFGTEIVGASQRWWDFPYENDVQDWRDTYESTNGQYWFETVIPSPTAFGIYLLTSAQPFITPALQYANMQLDAIPPGRPFSGHFSVQMSIAGETDHDLPARQYLLDTGSTFPMGYIDDICEIDPRGQRPPQAMISFDTTVGRIPRFVYLVYMQVRDDNEKALTGWHLSPFAINETPYPKVPRLSGLFPFLHAYWAKDPGEDPAFWKVSNRLAGVTGGLRRGKGDDLGL